MKTIETPSGRKIKVSDRDFEWASKFSWYFNTRGYPYRICLKNGRKNIPLHKEIYPHFNVDHKDADKLNCQRENLRKCNQSQNGGNAKISKANKTGFKGVSFRKRHKLFSAQISVNWKDIHLGYFKTPVEAAHAYDVAAKKYFGEFARPNFQEAG